MSEVSDLLSTDIEQYLRQHETKSLLRFITCGSVDDGKSTLIGRLLYEAKSLFEDQLAAVEADSKRWGTQGGEIDFALLVDGLAAEREQGITIDVAYRFFTTDKRKFIVADTPGPRAVHPQHGHRRLDRRRRGDPDRRAQGRADADAAPQLLVSLIGIRKVVLAINKMDLVDYAEAGVPRHRGDYREFAKEIGLEDITAMPLSALRGDNMLVPSAQHALVRRADADGLPRVGRARRDAPAEGRVPHAGAVGQPPQPRLPRLLRHDRQRHRQAGRRGPGPALRPGKPRRRASSPPTATCRMAVAGQSITLTLADEIDISRGDVISAARVAGRGGRPVRGDRRLDGRGADAPRPRLPAEDRRADAQRHPGRAEVPDQRQHPGAPGRQAARAQRDRRLQRRHWTGRCRSIPTPTTATPAASS